MTRSTRRHRSTPARSTRAPDGIRVRSTERSAARPLAPRQPAWRSLVLYWNVGRALFNSLVEHALFNYLYLSFYVERKGAELHFRLSAEHAGEKHALKIVEDPNVLLERVEIDGKEWKDFDPREGTVTLPRGENMKVRAVFGLAPRPPEKLSAGAK